MSSFIGILFLGPFRSYASRSRGEVRGAEEFIENGHKSGLIRKAANNSNHKSSNFKGYNEFINALNPRWFNALNNRGVSYERTFETYIQLKEIEYANNPKSSSKFVYEQNNAKQSKLSYNEKDAIMTAQIALPLIHEFFYIFKSPSIRPNSLPYIRSFERKMNERAREKIDDHRYLIAFYLNVTYHFTEENFPAYETKIMNRCKEVAKQINDYFNSNHPIVGEYLEYCEKEIEEERQEKGANNKQNEEAKRGRATRRTRLNAYKNESRHNEEKPSNTPDQQKKAPLYQPSQQSRQPSKKHEKTTNTNNKAPQNEERPSTKLETTFSIRTFIQSRIGTVERY